MGCLNVEGLVWVFAAIVVLAAPTCRGDTDPRDVYAMNSLYASLGFPLLPGWIAVGGDPCGQGWQGVQCVNANITGIILNGANLAGELSPDLGSFTSIIQIDLSNNHIGGRIPTNLPITIRSFFLSGNQLSGGIPDTISSLGQLTDLSLNNNNLTGAIPDAFHQLSGLINLDLSANSLGGQLPSSLGSLSSLTTLHLQNNQLVGTLDVLQDLPLRDLNVENNLFSGPIPDKLMGIPNFRRAGNPFNTSVLPSPPVSSPSPSPSGAQTPEVAPVKPANGPSAVLSPYNGRSGNKKKTKNITWVAIGGLAVIAALILGICLLLSQCCRRRQLAKKREMHIHSTKTDPKHGSSFQKSYRQEEKGPVHKMAVVRAAVGGNDQNKDKLVATSEGKDGKRKHTSRGQVEDHTIDMTGFHENNIMPPPPPPLPLPAERIIAEPILPSISSRRHSSKSLNSAKCFTIASLQQYTESFSQENLIGEGMLGTVYKAALPNGKLLAVKKLDTAALGNRSDQNFLDLVSNISKLQHPNIVELIGYCVEHGQRLLAYEYCSNGTLYEALHLDDEIHRKLTWNVRINLALQAARALEYLHENCQPPVVHQNFKSANILLDHKLTVRVSDCGLAPLLSTSSMTQLQTVGYGAPELELGSYTYQSDVYSFGVVMLELLTGRKSFDRSHPRGEQVLVRWAIPQLHDIDALSKMVDPSLNGAYPSKSLSRFADIISMCIQPEPEFRPPMSEIVQDLLFMTQRDA